MCLGCSRICSTATGSHEEGIFEAGKRLCLVIMEPLASAGSQTAPSDVLALYARISVRRTPRSGIRYMYNYPQYPASSAHDDARTAQQNIETSPAGRGRERDDAGGKKASDQGQETYDSRATIPSGLRILPPCRRAFRSRYFQGLTREDV